MTATPAEIRAAIAGAQAALAEEAATYADAFDAAEAYAVMLDAAVVLAASQTRIGMEGAIAEVVARLQVALPPIVATINAAHPDDIALEAPATDAYWPYLIDPRNLARYPAIVVFSQQTATLRHFVGNAYDLGRHLVVDVIDRDKTHAALTTRLQRWELAIFEALAVDGALACGACEFIATDWDQPRLSDRDSGELLQDVPLLFRIDTEESSAP